MSRRPSDPVLRRALLLVVMVVAPALVAAACGSGRGSPKAAPVELPKSRAWIEYAEQVVAASRPSPPDSARIYAYVATAYAETLRVSQDDGAASRVTAAVLDALQPAQSAQTAAFADGLGADETLPQAAQAVQSMLVERVKHDGFAPDDRDAAMATLPAGPGRWIRTSAGGPLAPQAGEWLRWVVGADYDARVPPPPVYGSAAYNREIEIARSAQNNLTDSQREIAVEWSGSTGTVQPPGIWLDLLWERAPAADPEFARTQAIATQAMADAMIECWKVKYTYWTGRPNQVLDNYPNLLPEPPFPAYVSGHAAASGAAATVLEKLAPGPNWDKVATEAANSRLWAGIHWDVDNKEGLALGERVGAAVLAKRGVSGSLVDGA